MCIHRIVILVASLVLAGPATGQWSENGRPAAETSWRKADGDLGAMLMITDDLQSFLDQWSKPAAPGYRPNISTTDEASRGDTVAAVVLFTSCARSESGSCLAVVDFRVVRPDGTVYAEHAGAPLWDEAPPPTGHLQLGISQLAFEIEPDDPFGEYRIETRVRDLVALRTVTLVRSIAVVQGAPHVPTDARP